MRGTGLRHNLDAHNRWKNMPTLSQVGRRVWHESCTLFWHHCCTLFWHHYLRELTKLLCCEFSSNMYQIFWTPHFTFDFCGKNCVCKVVLPNQQQWKMPPPTSTRKYSHKSATDFRRRNSMVLIFCQRKPQKHPIRRQCGWMQRNVHGSEMRAQTKRTRVLEIPHFDFNKFCTIQPEDFVRVHFHLLIDHDNKKPNIQRKQQLSFELQKESPSCQKMTSMLSTFETRKVNQHVIVQKTNKFSEYTFMPRNRTIEITTDQMNLPHQPPNTQPPAHTLTERSLVFLQNHGQNNRKWLMFCRPLVGVFWSIVDQNFPCQNLSTESAVHIHLKQWLAEMLQLMDSKQQHLVLNRVNKTIKSGLVGAYLAVWNWCVLVLGLSQRLHHFFEHWNFVCDHQKELEAFSVVHPQTAQDSACEILTKPSYVLWLGVYHWN